LTSTDPTCTNFYSAFTVPSWLPEIASIYRKARVEKAGSISCGLLRSLVSGKNSSNIKSIRSGCKVFSGDSCAFPGTEAGQRRRQRKCGKSALLRLAACVAGQGSPLSLSFWSGVGRRDSDETEPSRGPPPVAGPECGTTSNSPAPLQPRILVFVGSKTGISVPVLCG